MSFLPERVLVYFNGLHARLGFMVLTLFSFKFPLFLLHFWLPKAHVEASTEASMILASLLLKLGIYGFCQTLSELKFFALEV